MVSLRSTVVLFTLLCLQGVLGRRHRRGPNICNPTAENPCCGGWTQYRRNGPCIKPMCNPPCETGYCVAPDTCVCKDGSRGRDCHKKEIRRGCAELRCDHVCREVSGEARCLCRPGYTLTRDGITCRDLDECQVMVDACEHVCFNSLGSYHCRCLPQHILNADGRTCRKVPIKQIKDETPPTREQQWFRPQPRRRMSHPVGDKGRSPFQSDMLRNQPWGQPPDNVLPVSTRRERMEQAPPSGHLNPANSNGVVAGPCRRRNGCPDHIPCASGPCGDDRALPLQPDVVAPDSDCADNNGLPGPVVHPQVPAGLPGPCSDGLAGQGCGLPTIDEENICPTGEIFVESKDGYRVCIPTEDYLSILEEGCSEGETQIGPCTRRQLQERGTNLHTTRGLHAQEVCAAPCQNGGRCLNGACICPAGLQGKQCQDDIDECTDKMPCSHTCQNSFGSFQCTCPEGLALHTDGATCIRLFHWRYR